VFAFDLLEKLNGRIASAGVPALALIAQAIEPLARVDDRKRLADVSHRMGWETIA
jgi:hypothetical protein